MSSKTLKVYCYLEVVAVCVHECVSISGEAGPEVPAAAVHFSLLWSACCEHSIKQPSCCCQASCTKTYMCASTQEDHLVMLLLIKPFILRALSLSSLRSTASLIPTREILISTMTHSYSSSPHCIAVCHAEL